MEKKRQIAPPLEEPIIHEPMPDPSPIEKVRVSGIDFEIIHETGQVFGPDGTLIADSFIDYTKKNILGEFATLEAFIRRWRESKSKRDIKEALLEQHIFIEELRQDSTLRQKLPNVDEIDDFDLIMHIAFDRPPLTKRERVNNVKKRDYFARYSQNARAVLEKLLEQYLNQDVYEIEIPKVLNLPDFKELGSVASIMDMFGGKEGYQEAVNDLEAAIYNAESNLTFGVKL